MFYKLSHFSSSVSTCQTASFIVSYAHELTLLSRAILFSMDKNTNKMVPFASRCRCSPHCDTVSEKGSPNRARGRRQRRRSQSYQAQRFLACLYQPHFLPRLVSSPATGPRSQYITFATWPRLRLSIRSNYPSGCALMARFIYVYMFGCNEQDRAKCQIMLGLENSSIKCSKSVCIYGQFRLGKSGDLLAFCSTLSPPNRSFPQMAPFSTSAQ